jgi:hypothetical protein
MWMPGDDDIHKHRLNLMPGGADPRRLDFLVLLGLLRLVGDVLERRPVLLRVGRDTHKCKAMMMMMMVIIMICWTYWSSSASSAMSWSAAWYSSAFAVISLIASSDVNGSQVGCLAQRGALSSIM